MKVCVHCFNDLELKRYIVSNSEEKGKCDYCSDGINSELLDVGELLDFFAEFIKIFKIDDNGVTLVELIQKDWNLFSSKSECHDILSDILLAINSSITNPEECVSYVDEIIECTSYWETLKEIIKWEKRFLPDTEKLIYELGWDSLFKNTVKLSQSEQLFRARLHYSGGQKEFKVSDMGCPDKNKATAGRANPQGIPYLYLSKNVETTLYEIRATFLDEVSVGTFKINDGSEIILVDFTETFKAFSNVDLIIEYTKSIFLRKLISADLSIPLRRYDSEIEYIPTQFICEFIRNFTGADGILFNSSLHNGGKNVVLFSQDKVECVSVKMYRVTKVDIEAENIEVENKEKYERPVGNKG
jgi:hypothetical protein